MSRQKLLAYPYVEELEYRSQIDPHKMNLMLRSIEESVLRSILRGSELTTTFNQLGLGVTTSYTALARHIGTLFSYRDMPSDVIFATSYDTVITTGGGRQDRVAGITTLDWDNNRKYSKVPRYDSDEDGIPDSVPPTVAVYVDGTLRDAENEVYNALSRKNDAFWIEQTSAGSHTLEIQIPPSLNKNFNYIEIAPFPVFGVDITKVEYQDPRSVWNTIYDQDNKDYKFYNSSGPLVMHLAPQETNGTFKITFNVDSEIGVMGFSNIDVGLIDYRDVSQTVYMKVMNMPPRAVTTSYILLSSQLDFYVNGGQKADKFITELSVTNSTDGSGDTVPIRRVDSSVNYFGGQTIDLEPTENLYLKVVMKEVDMTTPVIRGCKLTYEV